MIHLVQYHTPDRMGCGIDGSGLEEDEPEVDLGEYRYSALSNKSVFDPDGMFIWMVGVTTDPGSPVYLGWWFRVETIVGACHEQFEFCYVGSSGGTCEPMPVISGESWYRQLLGMTGNFSFGLTEIKSPAVLKGLRAAAARGGCPQI